MGADSRRANGGECAIKADSEAQLRLLDVQAVDTALAQLAHRRKSLPEHVELARLRSERASVASNLVAADTAVFDLETEQTRAEADLEPVRERLARNHRRIADGTVPDPKALAGLIEEVEHLTHRITNLEDAELEIMEQLETANADRDRLRARAAELDSQIATTAAKRDQQLVELDGDVAERTGERGELAPQVPPDLMALYVKLGAAHGGVGAAELKARRCTGCQLEINAAELRQFAAAPDDEVLRCEECSRILIRTVNSGL